MMISLMEYARNEFNNATLRSLGACVHTTNKPQSFGFFPHGRSRRRHTSQYGYNNNNNKTIF